MGAEVDLELAEAQHFLVDRLGAGAPQQRLDAGQQLARLEGLGQVVVGAELEADDAVGGLAARGQHHQRQAARGRLAAQLAREVEAVAIGQHQVEHERVVRAGGQAHAAVGQRAGGIDVEALRAQIVADHARQARVVVDQQEMRIGHGGVGVPRGGGRRAGTLRGRSVTDRVEGCHRVSHSGRRRPRAGGGCRRRPGAAAGPARGRRGSAPAGRDPFRRRGVARTTEACLHAPAAPAASRRARARTGHHDSLQAMLPGRGQQGLRGR